MIVCWHWVYPVFRQTVFNMISIDIESFFGHVHNVFRVLIRKYEALT